jgi:hypothetical protein
MRAGRRCRASSDTCLPPAAAIYALTSYAGVQIVGDVRSLFSMNLLRSDLEVPRSTYQVLLATLSCAHLGFIGARSGELAALDLC